MAEQVTAAILVIGDEILSGRTKDKNIGYIAEYLDRASAIDLREVRVVPDVEEEIVAAVNALRARYTYLFTTGGIGPTHDDITADCVAKAFGVLDRRRTSDAVDQMLMQRMKRGGPERGAPVAWPASRPASDARRERRSRSAPGFRIGNVIVMAGVPAIMQAMLDDVAPRLKGGTAMLVETIEAAGLPEGAYAAALGEVARLHAGVSIGSYPSFRNGSFHNQIVVRGKDVDGVAAARQAVLNLIETLHGDRVPI